MGKIYDVCMPEEKPGTDKVYWNRVGIVFENEKGLSGKLFMFDKNIVLFERKPKEETQEDYTGSKPPWNG